ncbi:MAG: DUF1802 family protein [Capsulimonadaceae bacterium]
MLPETLNVSLKEWAVVQRSLLEGHQIILVRKGGLIEETGDFDLRAPAFLLFPTYEHQTERLGDIQPCFADWLHAEEARNPGRDRLRVEAAAEVTDVVRVADRELLVNLAPQHVWSRQFIDGRFDWEPYKPVFVLLLRAYRLVEPSTVDMRPEYGGCRSWIDLAEPIATSGAVPAVSDRTFEERRALTLKLLQG